MPGGYIPGMEDNSTFYDELGYPVPAENVNRYADKWKVKFSSIPEFKTTKNKTKSTGSTTTEAPEISDYPPCMAQLIVDGVPEGGRNNYVFNAAVLVKRAKGKVTEEDLQPFLKKVSGSFDDDINIIIDQVNDNDLKLVKYFFGTDKDAKKIFFTKNNNHRNIKEFVNDIKNFEKTNIINYEILLNKYDGNNIEIDVNLDNAGWLSVIDNWDPDWIATINDEKVEISKTLNAYKSIKLKKGFSKVKFQYKPW